MFQVVFCQMVLVPCLAVNGSLHKGLLRYIQLSQTVDYDMHMNIATTIVTVSVSTDKCLVSGKILFGIFHAKLLCQFSS